MVTPSSLAPLSALLVLAEDQTDGWVVGVVPQLIIHDIEVEVYLPDVTRLEWTGLEIDDHKAAQFEMVE